jgi:RNA polymerase sigma factor (sigma-70 family)
MGFDDVGSKLDDLRAGKRGALDELVADFSPLLWHVARAQGLDHDAAADVVQTTWLTFLQRLGDIRDPQALAGWLITVTRREAWRVGGAAQRLAATDDDEFERRPSDDLLPEDDLLQAERHRFLWAAVRRLSPRCQELLRVVAFARRPNYSTVAEALGMPIGSVGPTRGRCLAKLRDLLAADSYWSRS